MTLDQPLNRIYPDNPVLALPLEIALRLADSDVSKGAATVTLLVAHLARNAQGAVSERTFVSHPLVVRAGETPGSPVVPPDWPWSALELAIAHGLVLRFLAVADGGEAGWLLLNTENNVAMVGQLASGAMTPPESFWIDATAPAIHFDRPTVFRLYEQNVGPMTPLLAQQLIKATQTYPLDWIEDAITEAVAYNRRNWRYIARILENRGADGSSDRR
jgi:DNA replication protein